MKTYYMHTLDGFPASYIPGKQICFANLNGPRNCVLVPTLRQIRKEQQLSDEWRAGRGLTPNTVEPGYVRVQTPEETP